MAFSLDEDFHKFPLPEPEDLWAYIAGKFNSFKPLCAGLCEMRQNSIITAAKQNHLHIYRLFNQKKIAPSSLPLISKAAFKDLKRNNVEVTFRSMGKIESSKAPPHYQVGTGCVRNPPKSNQ